MAFEFGVFHEFQRRPGQSEAEAFTTAFEQVDAAERWGLDAIWLAEIHMAPERSVCSVPMTIASAIAARTRNIKIGTGVQVLPLCQPLRLAEDTATVDHISRGRLIFGVGRSGFPRAYEAYGIPYGESPERFAEVLEVVKRAWTEETIFIRRQILQLRKCLHRAKAVSSAASADPDRRQPRRIVHFRGKAGLRDFRRRPARHFRRGPAEFAHLPRRLEGGRTSRRGRGVSARPGLCRRYPRPGALRPRGEPDELLPLFGCAARRIGTTAPVSSIPRGGSRAPNGCKR